MSEYGLKIKNYEAGSIYEVMLGVRNNYDTTDAMFTNSLFFDFMMENGMKSWKDESTRDIICVEFNYGSRSYEEELNNIKKSGRKSRLDRRVAHASGDKKRINKAESYKNHLTHMYFETNKNQDKFEKKSADELRILFYENGISINYPIFDRDRKIKEYKTVHYKMLYRTPGKAKKGSCMFVKASLYNKASNFLRMGIKLKKKNAPIVEIGAYSSLITSTIVGRIKIDPEDILIVKDVKTSFTTNVVSVEIDAQKQCLAKKKNNYEVTNEIFDGQALIDSSIFPEWGNGYILLRHHFTKCAAFCSHIQKYYRDYFGDDYDTAEVEDMWGNKHLAKNIKMITTNNAIKWLKFDISYEYWCEWVRKNGCMFGIVKTAHESKLGNVQRMSYQMVNSLNEETIDNVIDTSRSYIEKLKTDNDVFVDYLRRNTNFSNDFEALAYLYDNVPEFDRCEYFRDRKRKIIESYVFDFKNGRSIQNADNLTIVGSPFAMLLHSVGEDVYKDPTFTQEDGTIQVWTSRFNDGEYLAEFRNPFNSRNNLGYVHNVYHEYFDRYFDLGKLIIAVNMIGTDFQDRNNGSDQDSDSCYTTNQSDIVAHAKYCYENYPTIVNNIPKDSNHYDNTLHDFALIDNKLAAAQRDIGESSNLAQICLTYMYNFEDEKFSDYVCILSVLAQIAIDNAKRSFDVVVKDEIVRIKADINLKSNGFPRFWLAIRKGFDKQKINRRLSCPMNYLYDYNIGKFHSDTSTLPVNDFFVSYGVGDEKRRAKKVEELIQKYSINLYKYNVDYDNDSASEYLLLQYEFDELIEDIRNITLPNKYIYIFSWLINRAFVATPGTLRNTKAIETKIDKNKALLIKVLYQVNKECLLKCFAAKIN